MAEQKAMEETPMNQEEEEQFEKLKSLVSEGDPHSKYRKLEKIALGGTGEVFLGKTIDSEKDVAIKVMRIKRYEETNMIKDRFIDEIYIHKNYPHEHIVKYLDSYIVADDLWVVMEYVDGVNLADVPSASITPVHMAAIGEVVLEVLQYLHGNNIVHGDTKCSNILLGKDGSIKVIDFGLAAKNTGDVRGLVGTLNWMAPEIVKEESYDEGVDIWAFGITMIEMMTGEAPYDKDEDEDVIEQIIQNGKPTIPNEDKLNPNLRDMLDQCLQVDSKMRSSAKDLLQQPFFTNVAHLKMAPLVKNMCRSAAKKSGKICRSC